MDLYLMGDIDKPCQKSKPMHVEKNNLTVVECTQVNERHILEKLRKLLKSC